MRISDWSSDVCSSDLVAKNLLLTNELSYRRKVREAILAMRIEDALTKEQILELYLNEIPLGRRSFGVQAASRAYFDKDVDQLALHEMAFLAILPKAPETYGRAKNAEKALARRNFVLSRSEEHTSELQSLMRISYAVFGLKKKKST